MKLASTDVLAELVSHAHQDLDRALQLWPFVAEQKLLGLWVGGRLPVAEACDRDKCDGRPHGDWPFRHAAKYDHETSPEAHSDPVGEQVANSRQQVEAGDQRAMLIYLDGLARLAKHAGGVEDAISRIRRARVALGSQVAAVDAALNAHRKASKIGVGPDGRVGTSGVSLEEADRIRKGAVEAEDACAACDLGVSEVGRLKKGLCNTDYQAWWRQGLPDGDRNEWVTRRRAALAARARAGAEIIEFPAPGDGSYRNLREVA